MKPWLLLLSLLCTWQIHATKNGYSQEKATQFLFLEAVKDNDPQLIKNILSAKVPIIDLNYKEEENGNTALHIACTKGFERIAIMLIKQGAINLNTQNNRGQSPLDCLNHGINRNRMKGKRTKPWRDIKTKLIQISKNKYMINNAFECPICFNDNKRPDFLVSVTQFCLHMLCRDCRKEYEKCLYC